VFRDYPDVALTLAPIARGATVAQGIARRVWPWLSAEECGYSRVWYAEHHDVPSIASSATGVLIAHVGVVPPLHHRGSSSGVTRMEHP
jgi:hypothetical protein